ncbi:MAG: FBP domain-containing protein [Candidatus Saccharibacteria bacterium]|nr:MAG: FBP domain-containing protein [Candidatus Saccharibacteria bacterium]
MHTVSRQELEDLLKQANIKPRLKRELRFVPEEITHWKERDFLAVLNKSKSEGVLIIPRAEATRILPFRLQKRTANASGRVEAIICDICATWQRGSNSAIISIVDSDKSSRSFLCCQDLDCSLHVRDITPAAAISRTQLRETMTVEDRIERLNQRLNEKF